MTPADLDLLIVRTLVDCLSDRVVAALQARRRTALLLFTGTDLGLEPALAGLEALRRDGWVFTAVLSPRAEGLVPAARLRALGDVAVPADAAALDRLLDGSGLVVVPTLTVTTAAKVAGVLRDSLASYLLARALETGKGVIAAVDGCCPDNPQRAARGFQVADSYKARLRANLEALRGYGVRLTTADALAGKLAATLAGTVAVQPAGPAAQPVAAAPTISAPPRTARIFSRSDAALCAGPEIRLPAGVLVTPAAADLLRTRNIRLIQG